MSAKEKLDFVEKAYKEGNMPVWDYEKFKEEFKEKTAREMFEELGYEYDECYFDETIDDIYYQKKGKYTPQIQFSLNHKVVKVYREGNKSSFFDIKLLQAINKQIEELGWK